MEYGRELAGRERIERELSKARAELSEARLANKLLRMTIRRMREGRAYGPRRNVNAERHHDQ